MWFSLTAVYANTQFNFMVRFMANCKVLFNSLDKVKCHTRDFASMMLPISDWKTRYHHVSVTYCLNLKRKYGMRLLQTGLANYDLRLFFFHFAVFFFLTDNHNQIGWKVKDRVEILDSAFVCYIKH